MVRTVASNQCGFEGELVQVTGWGTRDGFLLNILYLHFPKKKHILQVITLSNLLS